MIKFPRNSLSVILTLTLVLFCYAIAPIEGSNMENMKSELREGSANGGRSGGNTLNTGASNGAGVFGNRRNLRSIYGLGPKMLQISRSKIPIELDLLVENEDGDRSKRFDDYGHMRFGKRGGEEQFDDYGHMRFGRST